MPKTLENLPYEMKLDILKKIDNMDLLRNMCSSSKTFRDVCKENWNALIEKIEPKISVIQLENYDIYGAKEFKSEKDAIEYFEKEIKGYQKVLDEYDVEYDITKDIYAGMIKVTYNDDSDKVASFLICGLSLSQNKKLMNELLSNNSDTFSDDTRLLI
jgi:hypothetical protein